MKFLQTKNNSTCASTQSSFFQKESNNFLPKSEKPFFNASPLQTKLTVNQPSDPYEKEADAMADKVVQRSSNKSFSNKENNQTSFFTKSNRPVLDGRPVRPP